MPFLLIPGFAERTNSAYPLDCGPKVRYSMGVRSKGTEDKNMANAKKTPAVTKTVVVEPEKIVLELTAREAFLVRHLCGQVYGDDEDSARKYTSDVYYALGQAGVKNYFDFNNEGNPKKAMGIETDIRMEDMSLNFLNKYFPE